LISNNIVLKFEIKSIDTAEKLEYFYDENVNLSYDQTLSHYNNQTRKPQDFRTVGSACTMLGLEAQYFQCQPIIASDFDY
jgi:hypothetical protein